MADSYEKNASEADDRYHRVADYLNGHLSPEELLAFQEELIHNQDLKQLLEFQQALAATVRRRERDALKERLKQLRADDNPDLGRTGTYSLSEPSSDALHSTTRSRFSIAAVISLLLVSGAAIYFLTTNTLPPEASVAETHDTVRSAVADNSTTSDTSPKTSVGFPYPGSDKKSAPVFLSEADIEVSAFPVAGTGFGFARKSKMRISFFEVVVSEKGGASEKNGYYELTKTELRLFVGKRTDIGLYQLESEEVSEVEFRLDDESKKIKAGYYLYLDDVLYALTGDGLRHELIPMNADIQRILFTVN